MFDTSVLTPGLIQTLDFHERALPWLDKVTNGELDADDYFIAVERTARLGISGGAIYDALIVQAAVKSNAEQIVTFNERHFVRVSEGLPLQIIVP